MLLNFVVICMATCILQHFGTSATLWHPIILIGGEVYRHKNTAVTVSRRVHKIKIISIAKTRLKIKSFQKMRFEWDFSFHK
jgi:hypothetical protein